MSHAASEGGSQLLRTECKLGLLSRSSFDASSLALRLITLFHQDEPNTASAGVWEKPQQPSQSVLHCMGTVRRPLLQYEVHYDRQEHHEECWGRPCEKDDGSCQREDGAFVEGLHEEEWGNVGLRGEQAVPGREMTDTDSRFNTTFTKTLGRKSSSPQERMLARHDGSSMSWPLPCVPYSNLCTRKHAVRV